jgi:hypothetical protein
MDVLMTLVHLKLLYGHWSEAPSPDLTGVSAYYDLRLGRLQHIHPPHPDPSEESDAPLGVEETGHAAR